MTLPASMFADLLPEEISADGHQCCQPSFLPHACSQSTHVSRSGPLKVCETAHCLGEVEERGCLNSLYSEMLSIPQETKLLMKMLPGERLHDFNCSNG